MHTFDEFLKDFFELVKKYDTKLQLKIEQDSDSDIVKVFGENFSSLSRAKNGLGDVAELSYATAEHHPYWNLLYGCVQILHLVLEKWETVLDKDDLDEIRWFTKELIQVCDKIENQF